MKLFVALALLFFSHTTAGSLFTKGVEYNDLYHRRVPLYHDELKSVLGSPLQSQRLLAMMSGRVHVPVARAMMSRYVNQYGFGTFLRPAIRNVISREDLASSIIMFLHMAKTVGNTIIDRLHEEADSRIYTFVEETTCNCSWLYLDEQDHEVRGFFKDLVLEVCKEANKKCIVHDVPYNMCLRTDPSSDLEAAGEGLLAGYFDGCAFTKTTEVVHAVKLSDKFMNYGGESRFFVPVGNPGNFDPNDISGKTIGFVKGWYSTRRCLVANNVEGARTLTFNRTNFMDFSSDIPRSFDENKIDASFMTLELFKEGGDYENASAYGGTPPGLEPIGNVIHCTDGAHLGVRKDSHVLDWFNAALRRMKESGKYAKVCRRSRIEHGARGWLDCSL